MLGQISFLWGQRFSFRCLFHFTFTPGGISLRDFSMHKYGVVLPNFIRSFLPPQILLLVIKYLRRIPQPSHNAHTAGSTCSLLASLENSTLYPPGPTWPRLSGVFKRGEHFLTGTWVKRTAPPSQAAGLGRNQRKQYPEAAL